MLLGSPLPLRLPLLLAVVMMMVVVVFPAALAARPPPRDRLFVSVVVDAAIASVSAHIADPQLRAMFEQTLPNTLDTTVYYDAANNDTVLITGDIAAMWLRDASNQVRPYLRYASQDPKLAAMLRGLLRRMSECVLTDPYANAFNQRPDAQAGGNQADMTTRPSFLGTRVGAMTRQVFERKFEIDSLLAFIKLANGYWAATADDAPFRDPQFLNAVQAALQVLAQQQLSPLDARDANPPYTFLRTTTVPTGARPWSAAPAHSHSHRHAGQGRGGALPRHRHARDAFPAFGRRHNSAILSAGQLHGRRGAGRAGHAVAQGAHVAWAGAHHTDCGFAFRWDSRNWRSRVPT